MSDTFSACRAEAIHHKYVSGQGTKIDVPAVRADYAAELFGDTVGGGGDKRRHVEASSSWSSSRYSVAAAAGTEAPLEAAAVSSIGRITRANANVIDQYAQTTGSVRELCAQLEAAHLRDFEQAFRPMHNAIRSGQRVIRASTETLQKLGPQDHFGVDTKNIRHGFIALNGTQHQTHDGILRKMQGFYQETNGLKSMMDPRCIGAMKQAAAAVEEIQAGYRAIRAVGTGDPSVASPGSGGFRGNPSDGAGAQLYDTLGGTIFGRGNGPSANGMQMLAQLNPTLFGGRKMMNPQEGLSNLPGVQPTGFFNEFTDEEQDQYRWTWDKLLTQRIQKFNQGLIMDTAERYMDIVHKLGPLRVVDVPFTMYVVSQEFDPMMMDLDAEEVPYREGIWRGRSEKRSFTRFGKSLRVTIESQQLPEGRAQVVYKTMQIGAATGQTECYIAVQAIKEAARTEETRGAQNRFQAQQPRSKDEGIRNLCNDVGRWARLQREGQSLSTINADCSKEYDRRYPTGLPSGRSRMFLFGRGTETAIGGSSKGIEKVVIPIMKPDRATEIDALESFKQHGEYVPIPWDPKHPVYGGAKKDAYANYNYDSLAVAIKHNSGRESRITLGQIMRHYQNYTRGDNVQAFWRTLFNLPDGDVVNKDHICAQGKDEEEMKQRLRIVAAQKEALGPDGEVRAKPGYPDEIVTFKADGTVDLSGFRFCIEHHLPLFLNGRHVMNHIVYNMGEGIMYAKGEGTYEHYITRPIMQFQATAEHRNISMSVRKDTMALVKDSRSLIMLYALNVINYVAGDEPNSYWHPDDTTNRGPKLYQSYVSQQVQEGEVSELPSAFLMLDSVDDDCCMEDAMDLVGRFNPSLNIDEGDKSKVHYKMCEVYCAMYGWNHEAGTIAMIPGRPAADGVGGQTLLFRRCAAYWILDEEGGQAAQKNYQRGSGPRAGIIYDDNFKNASQGGKLSEERAKAEIMRVEGKTANLFTSGIGYGLPRPGRV
jgi:hypothetical protein